MQNANTNNVAARFYATRTLDELDAGITRFAGLHAMSELSNGARSCLVGLLAAVAAKLAATTCETSGRYEVLRLAQRANRLAGIAGITGIKFAADWS